MLRRICPTAFGLSTGIATAMVDYPIGDLIHERVRAMGVKPFYKKFKHDGVQRAEYGDGVQRPGLGVRAPVVFYNRCNEAAAHAEAGRFRLEGDLCRGRALVSLGRHLFVAVGDDFGAGD